MQCWEPCATLQPKTLNVQLSIKKRRGTCRDNLTRASLSIIIEQTRTLPLLAVCTLSLCTLCLFTLCLCTVHWLHSPRIPSSVVASLSISHAHCIPTNVWQLTNRSYKIFTYNMTFETWLLDKLKGWGLSAKLGKHSAIWGKLGTALQAYALNPCTKFPLNPTSRKVNT